MPATKARHAWSSWWGRSASRRRDRRFPAPPHRAAPQRRAPPRGTGTLLQASPPEVLPCHAIGVEIGSGPGVQPGVRVELHRVVPGKGQRESEPETRARLAIVARNAVQRGASALVIRGADRAPHAPTELARDMELGGIERILLAHVALYIVAVFGEESDARAQLEGPQVQRLRQAELGLRRPAVGAEVRDAVGVVPSERRGDKQARADDQVLPVSPELLQV